MTLVKNLTVQDINTSFLSLKNEFISKKDSDNNEVLTTMLPIGGIVLYASTEVPQNYLLCDGRDTSNTKDEIQTYYPLLYDLIGTNVLPNIPSEDEHFIYIIKAK